MQVQIQKYTNTNTNINTNKQKTDKKFQLPQATVGQFMESKVFPHLDLPEKGGTALIECGLR